MNLNKTNKNQEKSFVNISQKGINRYKKVSRK